MRGEAIVLVLFLMVAVAGAYSGGPDGPPADLGGGDEGGIVLPDAPETPAFGGGGAAPDTASDSRDVQEQAEQNAPDDPQDNIEESTSDEAVPEGPSVLLWGLIGLAVLTVLGGAVFLLLRHKQHDDPLPKPAMPKPAAQPGVDYSRSALHTGTSEVDLNVLKEACKYVEDMRARGVAEQTIRAQLAKSAWPDSYISIALRP